MKHLSGRIKVDWAILGGAVTIWGIVITIVNGRITKLSNNVVYKDSFAQFEKRFESLGNKVDNIDIKIDRILEKAK